MGKCFMTDFLNFTTRRVEAAKRVYPLIEDCDPPMSGLNEEEFANAKEAVARDAIYIQGLADGMRLVRIITEKEDDHV